MKGQSLPIKEVIKSLDTCYDNTIKALDNFDEACEDAIVTFTYIGIIALLFFVGGIASLL